MKQIETSKKGLYVLVDEEDYDSLLLHSWSVVFNNKTQRWQISCSIDNKKIKIHRFILGVNDPTVKVVHLNGNLFDNRRENLLCVTSSQSMSRKVSHVDSNIKYKGVFKNGNSFKASICVDYDTKYLGQYKTPEEAAKAYNVAAKEYYGELATLNEV